MPNLYMSGLEFIDKIVMQGERNFRRVQIPDGFDMRGDEGKALVRYLKENYKLYLGSPLDFSGASLRYLTARNLFLPWLLAVETDFTGARLGNCQLTYAHLERAIFREANLSPDQEGRTTSFTFSRLVGADFEKANLQKVHFEFSDLSKTNFTSSYLHSADFTSVILCHVQGLESAIDLEQAKIERVTATEKEKKIILSAKSRQMFGEIIDSNIN